MAKDADLSIWSDLDIKSSVAGQLNPLFKNFKQSDKMNINCEVDDVENGAPLAFDRSWNFNVQNSSPALPTGLAFFGIKKVMFFDIHNDQNYYFTAPTPTSRFGATL